MLTCLMLDGRPRPKLILNLKLSSFPTYVENKNKEILLFSGHSYSNHLINHKIKIGKNRIIYRSINYQFFGVIQKVILS